MSTTSKIFSLISFVGFTTTSFGININPTSISSTLTDALVGDLPNGVTILGSSFTGVDGSAATYNGLSYSRFAKVKSGVLLTSGSALLAAGPNTSEYEGIDNGGPQDTFDNYDGNGNSLSLNDVCRLDIDFTSTTTRKLSFSFVFGSEEYYEYVNSPFNDAFFAFMDSNPNSLALDSNDNPITVNNRFFGVDNRGEGWSEYDYNNENYLPINSDANLLNELQYDGFTPVLKTTFTVTPGQHRISFVIGDAGDSVYDSGVFLARAFQSSTNDDGTGYDDPVPEPSSIAAVGFGVLALSRRRKKKS